ncbi:MAG: gliding motility-associated C-terminal domain-containing protein, partial [Bacteroidales bacterium]|nr:gliding motility-associated C-terminal domain-containing protein [Bacteroidales bacterium]
CSVISSPEGDLLFYTDGVVVYNAMHNLMNPDTALKGNSSATQSGVIVPIPNVPDKFYIFTVNSLEFEHTGLHYSVVNMEANNGLGKVVSSNKLISASSTERITSIHHENDYGVWVIMHEWESNRFHSYLVTSDGIDLNNPVYSTIGSYHGGNNSSNRDGIGYMKISPDGKKLAVAIMGQDKVELFDFNDVTGEIANPIELPVDTMPYGVEFSAGAEFLYASERKGNKIYQWDINAGSPQDIINSREIVGILSNPFGGALQMASDGKIYIARRAKFYLSVINQPYLKGTACDFDEVGIELGGRQSKEGLPTFIQSYFNNPWFIVDNNCIDKEIFFSVISVINIDSVRWDFGDPQSGDNNTALGYDVSHYFTMPGLYIVKATFYHLTTQTEVVEPITIFPLPEVDLGADIEICTGDSIRLEVDPNYDIYMWNNNPYNNNYWFYASEEGQIKIMVSNICGTDSDDAYLSLRELPFVDLGEDLEIEYQAQVYIDAGNHTGYEWNDSSTLQELMVDYPGKYWVEVWDDFGCKSSDTILIEPIPFQFFVPNAFAPEGTNKKFEIFKTYEVDIEYHLMIFNRWGEIVFETNSPDEFWDGTFNSLPCPLEVYIWILDAKSLDDNPFFSGKTQLTGTVTLLR